MVAAHWIPVPDPDIICRLTDDGAVLVSPEAGDLRVLNASGATIWQLLDGRRTVAQVEAELSRRYRIPDDQARADLGQFLSDLHGRGLLRWLESDTP